MSRLGLLLHGAPSSLSVCFWLQLVPNPALLDARTFCLPGCRMQPCLLRGGGAVCRLGLGRPGPGEPSDIVPPPPALLPRRARRPLGLLRGRRVEPGAWVFSVPVGRWPDVSNTPRVPLLVILAKYGLDGRKDTQAVNSNYLSDTAEDDSLGDPKLEKLWHKVPLALPGIPTTCALELRVGGAAGAASALRGSSFRGRWSLCGPTRLLSVRPPCFPGRPARELHVVCSRRSPE